MSNLQESPVWVDAIYQLTDETPVLGKTPDIPGVGPSNIQAQQLANRSRWLKWQLESAQDYREYSFHKSETDPDGTIAGIENTPDGKMFRVAQGTESEYSFIYYLNANGVAYPVATLIGKGYVDGRVSQVDGENITEIHDETGNVIGYLAADGRLFLPYLNEAVQDILSRLSGLVSSRGGTDIFSFGDGKNETFIQASDGRIYVPLLQMSIQDEINGLKKNSSTSPSIASVDTRNQVGSAAYIVVPEGYLVDQIKWLRDGVVIPGATGYAYVLTSADMMKKITMTTGSLLGGNRVSDKTAGQIGGIALESAGATGSLYEGFTLSAGDDFNTLDILTPQNPGGKWFTTRTYLNPPRGSDTILGTMYDADPFFTGFNDSNRGVPVGFDNMRADDGVLRLQARAATDAEKIHMQGSRHELAAMVSSVGAFSFYAGPAGTG
ncbi:hypothetical protein FML31_23760, partial [Klebsiella oxytoca]|nr:hypothetical protein [Klebsiella oxytoca]